MAEIRAHLNSAFNTALSAPDSDFARYLEKMAGLYNLATVMLNASTSLPPGQTMDSIALAAFSQPEQMPFKTQVDMLAPSASHGAMPNNTGIRANMPMQGEMSVARYDNFSTVTLNQHICTSCSGPAAARQMNAACDDLSDPAQVRGGQLIRMAVGLHETAHALYFNTVYSSPLEQADKTNLIRSHSHSEAFADAFAAIVIMRELGPEGVAFMRQYAAGFRDISHATDSNYGANTTLLAQLISVAEQDPKALSNTPDVGLARIALEATRLTLPSSAQESALHNYFKEHGLEPREGRPPLEGATARLAWYAEQQAMAQRGEPHAKDILPLYERFVLPGDRIMMTPEALQQNLQTMVDLGPLKNNAIWQEQAQAAVQECRAPQQRPATPTTPAQ